MLIDGQQRHHDADAARSRRSTTRCRRTIPTSPPSSSGCSCAPPTRRAPSCGRTARGRRSSRAWCSTGATPGDELRDSRFDDNYAFFRSQISADEAPRIWRGLQKLEHVAITLGAGANAQQIFESLNSTGEPLRDHELIHNYVLMGLSHAEQSEIEDVVLGADRAEHRRVDRQLLAALPRHDARAARSRSPASAACTTRSATSSRGSTSRTCARTPRSGGSTRRSTASLLDPAHDAGCRDRRASSATSTPSARGMYPLVMRAYRDHARGAIDRDDAHRARSSTCSRCCCAARSWASAPTASWRGCAARARTGQDSLVRAIAPHHALRRARARRAEVRRSPPRRATCSAGSPASDRSRELDVEHIFPLVAGRRAGAATASASGRSTATTSRTATARSRRRSATSPCSRSRSRSAPSIASFPEKRAVYARSDDRARPRELADVAVVGHRRDRRAHRRSSPRDSCRSGRVRRRVGIDDDGLTPILDAAAPPRLAAAAGSASSSTSSTAASTGRCTTSSTSSTASSSGCGRTRATTSSPSARAAAGRSTPRSPGTGSGTRSTSRHFLYMGWDSKYMLTAVQGVLEEAGPRARGVRQVLLHRRRDVVAHSRSGCQARPAAASGAAFGRHAWWGGWDLNPRSSGYEPAALTSLATAPSSIEPTALRTRSAGAWQNARRGRDRLAGRGRGRGARGRRRSPSPRGSSATTCGASSRAAAARSPASERASTRSGARPPRRLARVGGAGRDARSRADARRQGPRAKTAASSSTSTDR